MVWIGAAAAPLRLQSDSCRPRNAMARPLDDAREFLRRSARA
jgi:hypothetical protein